MKKTNPYLRLISGGQTVTISACKGGEKANIYNAEETFLGYIDTDFNDYGINLPQPATKETHALVYEMYGKNADFKTLFESLSSDLKSLAFESQEQIVKFAEENKEWLGNYGYGTFFFFTEIVDGEEQFFVANININMWHSHQLLVYVFHLSNFIVQDAITTFRIVVPATKHLETQH